MNFSSRQAAVREKMAAAGLEGLLVSHLPNIRYLCGYSGSNGLLLLSSAGTTLFTDGRYREQAAQEVEGARLKVPARGDLWKAAAEAGARCSGMGLEAEHVTLAQRERWLRHWPGEARRLRFAGQWIEALRAVKEPDEVAAIRRAVVLASSVFMPTLKKLRTGMKETEAAGLLEFRLRRAGGEGLAFDTIVASGTRSALVHGTPGAEALPQRGFVVMDYGVILGGYVSDMTRTAHAGRPSRRAREVYDTVCAAQAAAIAVVRAGIPCAAVDRAARQVIQRAGWGQYFPHSTGHGVGLEIHEAPRLAATSSGSLLAGQVITIEPGIYIPGWGGVRIEDVAVVTEDGCEVLTPTSKEMQTF